MWLPPAPTQGALRARSARAPRTQNPHCPLKVQAHLWAQAGAWEKPQEEGTPGHPGSRVPPLGSISVDPSPHTQLVLPRGEGEQSCSETMLTSHQRGSQVPIGGCCGDPGQLLPTATPACACLGAALPREGAGPGGGSSPPLAELTHASHNRWCQDSPAQPPWWDWWSFKGPRVLSHRYSPRDKTCVAGLEPGAALHPGSSRQAGPRRATWPQNCHLDPRCI